MVTSSCRFVGQIDSVTLVRCNIVPFAVEIATTERLRRSLSLKLAMQLWPTLDLDPHQSAGWPTSIHKERPTA
jgi:hypothetical protein